MGKKPTSVRRSKSKGISWTRVPRRGVVVKKKIQWGLLFKTVVTRIRFWLGIVIMFAVIASPYIVWRYFEEHEVFVIERVTVLGSVHYLPVAHIEQLTQTALNKNFIGFDVSSFQHKIELVPWVKSVKVTRKWFKELEVVLVERQPVALWNYNAMIEADGTIFYPENLPQANFVRLVAESGNERLLLDQLVVVRQKLAQVRLRAEEISVDHRLSWSIVLDNGVQIILGTEDFTLRLTRFVNHYSNQLADKMAQIKSIDMRYENGFAVKWYEE